MTASASIFVFQFPQGTCKTKCKTQRRSAQRTTNPKGYVGIVLPRWDLGDDVITSQHGRELGPRQEEDAPMVQRRPRALPLVRTRPTGPAQLPRQVVRQGKSKSPHHIPASSYHHLLATRRRLWKFLCPKSKHIFGMEKNSSMEAGVPCTYIICTWPAPTVD